MINPMRQRSIDGLKAGDTFSVQRTFSQQETMQFGEITWDYNPVHDDSRWAAAKGFDGLICHGLLVGSMICDFGGQVGWLATGMQFKFLKPVYFGDTITCTITIEKIEASGRAQAEAVFRNQQDVAVGYASLSGRLPRDAERGLLQTIAREKASDAARPR